MTDRLFWHAKERQELTQAEALSKIEALSAGDIDVALETENGEILTLVLCGARGFVMLMREAGDAGRVASEPSKTRRQWSFTLSNGQRDTYPDRQTVSRHTALKLARQFVIERTKLSEFLWI